MDKTYTSLQHQVQQIKSRLTALGPMRPGTLSRQARARGGTYYQLSYSHAGKGHSEYVREDYAETIRTEIGNYRTFRELNRRWVEAELALSKHRQRLANQAADNVAHSRRRR